MTERAVYGQTCDYLTAYELLPPSFSDGISGTFQLTCGVPQGSCLGPLLLTLYANKLCQVLKKHSPTAHAYADDKKLYLSFKPEGDANEKECLEAME